MGSLFGGGGDQNAANSLANEQQSAVSQLLTSYFGASQPAIQSLLNGGAMQYLMPLTQTLSNNIGAQNQGLAQSLSDQSGGVANPNALAESLATSGFNSAAGATQALGSQAGSQSLSALLSALGVSAQPLSSSLQGLGQTAGQFANAAANQQAGNAGLFGSLLQSGATIAAAS
jgi:hypothetical protein